MPRTQLQLVWKWLFINVLEVQIALMPTALQTHEKPWHCIFHASTTEFVRMVVLYCVGGNNNYNYSTNYHTHDILLLCHCFNNSIVMLYNVTLTVNVDGFGQRAVITWIMWLKRDGNESNRITLLARTDPIPVGHNNSCMCLKTA